jgi:hypothetical protein
MASDAESKLTVRVQIAIAPSRFQFFGGPAASSEQAISGRVFLQT